VLWVSHLLGNFSAFLCMLQIIKCFAHRPAQLAISRP
jgi:hypothetical protein